MFADRYFPKRYFADRYFVNQGEAETVTVTPTVGGRGKKNYPRVYRYRDQRILVKNQQEEANLLDYIDSDRENQRQKIAKLLPKKKKAKKPQRIILPPEEPTIIEYTMPDFSRVSMDAINFDLLASINDNFAQWQQNQDDDLIMLLLLAA